MHDPEGVEKLLPWNAPGACRIPQGSEKMRLKKNGARQVNSVIDFANGEMSRREFDLDYSGYVVDYFPGFEEEHPHLASRFADIIVVAEIAPDYRDFLCEIPESSWDVRGYVCIDGYHQIEKARRMGLETLPAVILRMEQHVPFLYSGYEQYTDYWNRKLEERSQNAQRISAEK